MTVGRLFVVLAGATVLLFSFSAMWKQRLQGGQSTVQGWGIVHAPDFPPGGTWLNTDRPLSLKALRGKFVLLDFWTFC